MKPERVVRDTLAEHKNRDNSDGYFSIFAPFSRRRVTRVRHSHLPRKVQLLIRLDRLAAGQLTVCNRSLAEWVPFTLQRACFLRVAAIQISHKEYD